MKATFFQGWETGTYNPDTCNNGGGYWQYSGWCALDNGWFVEIQNTSCGDFGDRISAQFYAPDGVVFCINIGNMDDFCIDNDYADDVCCLIFIKYGLDMWEMYSTADDTIDVLAGFLWEQEQFELRKEG